MRRSAPVPTGFILLATALVLGAATLHAADMKKKPAPADVGAGRVAWFDLTTTDIAKSKEFYAKLLGWTYTALPGTDQAVEIVSGDTAIGTLRGAEGAISGYNGVVYVQVDDAAVACAKAKELGGTLIPGFPFNLPDRDGAIGLILDPAGHPLGLYSRKSLPAKAK